MTDITRVVLAVDSSQVRTATRDLDGMNKSTKSTTSTVAGLGKVLAGAFAAVGGAKLATDLYKVNAEAQRLKASLITVTGSIGSANVAWAQMEAFARTTPYSLTQAIEGFTKMKALGLDPTTSSMTAFGNVAAAMGKDLTQMIEAVADASTGEFERLKEFGIKAKQEGDRVSLTFQGVTTQIGNNAKEITGYLEDIGNNQFGGAMARQMDTLGGATSNLGDNFDALMRTIGESGGNSGMIGVINGLSAAIVDFTNTISSNADEITDFIDQIVFYSKAAKLILDEITEGTKDDPWYMLPVTRGPTGALYRYMGFGGKQEFEGDRDDIVAGIEKIRAELEEKKIERQMLANGEAAERWMAEQDKLNGAVDKSDTATKKFTRTAKELKDVIGDEVITEVEAAAKEFAKLRDELYPQQAAVRDLMHEYELFSTFAPGALDDWIDKLKVAPDELHRSAEAIDELTEKADPFGKIWDTTIERLQGSIADMFYDMLENGKVTFDNILDLFKRMVAEMAAQKFVMAIGLGGLGASSSAAAGGLGGTSAGGGINLNTITSLFSADGLGAGISGIFTGLGSTLNNVLPSAISSALSQSGYSIISDAAFESAVLNGGLEQGWNLSAGVGGIYTAGMGILGGYGGTMLGESLLGKEAESPYGATAGAAAGAYIGSIVPVLGTAVGALIGGIIGGIVDVASGGDGKKRYALGVSTNPDWRPTEHATLQQTAASGLTLTSYQKRTGPDGNDVAEQMTQVFLATDAALTGFFESLGVTVDLAGQMLDGKASQFGEAVDGFFGAAGYNGLNPEDLAGAVDEFVFAWVDRVNELTKSAIDLQPLVDIQREGELLADVLIRVQAQIAPVNAILGALGVAAYDVSVSGMAAADGLVAAFGGLESFTSALQSYYATYYSAEERTNNLRAQVLSVFESLNMAMPTTRDGFRALVTDALNAGQAGQETAAALLSVSGAFAELTPAVETVAEAVDLVAEAVVDTVAEISQAMLTLQSQTKTLEIELLKAQGLDAEAQAAQYALDTEGLTAAEIAVYEYNQSIIAQIQAIEAAKAAAESAAQAQAAEAARAADEALRIEQQKNAAIEAAAKAAAQRAAAIASERYGLENQLLQLQGNTAALRERELSELHPSNRALQQQIWALEDQKTAAEAAAQASEELASTWGSIADNLLAEAQRIRDTASGDAMSFAGAQAQFAILTAQARAGNMDAAESLPGASQRLLELGMGQARTRADYIRLASATATSLEGTASTITSPDALAKRSTEALEQMQRDQANQLITIQQLTVTTNRMSRLWDDVTQGGTTIRTTETTP